MDDSPEGGAQSSLPATLLIAAWGLTLTMMAGGGAWLFLTGSTENGASPARVTMSLNSYRDAEPVQRDAATVDGRTPVAGSGQGDTATAHGKNMAKREQIAAAGMHPHPDLSLLEQSDLGPLPVIGKDGRVPWRVYARPYSLLDERPRIAIVIAGLGISETLTQQVIESMPGEVTLSFAAFSKNLKDWIDKSRADGHEVLIDLPMEPLDYPASDPGPRTLLASVPIDQNLRQLEWILSRATGYIGVATHMGSGLGTKPRALNPILAELNARGLLLVDTRENPVSLTGKLAREIGMTVATNESFIDRQPAGKIISKRLAELESKAKDHGGTVAVARPLPVTLRQLQPWIAGLKGKGIALAPVSALATTKTK